MAKKENENKFDALRTSFLKKFGNNSLITEIKEEFVSTNSLRLDYALGGRGFLKGRYYQFFGREGSSKSAVAAHLAGIIQTQGGAVMWIDSEQTLRGEYTKQTFGFDYQKDNSFFSRRMNATEVLQMVEEAIPFMQLIVIDSTDALIPNAAESGILGDANVGGISKISAEFFRRILQKLSDNDCILIAISHEKDKLNLTGYGGGGTDTSGGSAWKFFASMRLKLAKKEVIKVGDDIVGQISTVKLIKNKVDNPWRNTEIILRYHKGFDVESEVFDLSKEFDLIEQGGAWFNFNKELFPELSELKFQGGEKVINYLKEHSDINEKLTVKIKSIMAGGEI